MNFKKEIEKLLFNLKLSNIDRATIEKELNYAANYIDQVLAKGGNKRFYENLKRYADQKQENISKSNIVSEPSQPVKVKIFETNIEKEISGLIEKQISMQASINVLQQIMDKLISDQTGKSIANVTGERRQAEKMEANRLFDELK
jgi:hypothetical protein